MCYSRNILHSSSLPVSKEEEIHNLNTMLIAGVYRYNSAVFTTLASDSFNWVVVTPDYMNNAPWDLSATNTTLQERGREEVMGLVADRGLPVMQP